MTVAEELEVLREEAQGWKREWAIRDSRCIEAEALLKQAGEFIGNIKVGVTLEKRNAVTGKIDRFLTT